MDKIVFLDAMTVSRQGDVDLFPFSELGEFVLHDRSDPSNTAERLNGATVALSNKVVIDRAIMSKNPSLKLICVCATGTNNVDLEAAKEHGVHVCNVSGYSTPTVAAHTFTLLLNLATQTHRYGNEPQKWAESPFFSRLDYPVVELEGKMLGIAGLGDIGRRVAGIALAMGMQVQKLAREGSGSGELPAVDRETFFRTSDAITLHCPLTPDTENMINAESLGWMKDSAFLINTGRGGLVDEPALIEALKQGQLAGAGLDVISQEPPSPDHPMLAPGIPNLLLTPHTAWSSVESRSRLMRAVHKNIRSFQAGNPINVVA